MLSTDSTTNYWARNALARVRFLEKENCKKSAIATAHKSKTDIENHHNQAVKELQKIRRNYFLGPRHFL
ncbi:hypothetical protein IQ256_05900 [cf. Phormidesmis sp. LEGE 11477]|nr:hypothetical protein [cf. Phormidesmis sp. LEGE 11477]